MTANYTKVRTHAKTIGEAARSWMSTELENTDTEDYFTADVGEDRKAYIDLFLV